ncbi:hypothetical protein [Corynebacterium pacaense]|uniref:hypothetical protein n=1 Tax=Corynebacterium pacaense TaxID=1816684 RepID=UPI0009BB3C74|nr:hypothetical protein [Corynebacterium pacaense]
MDTAVDILPFGAARRIVAGLLAIPGIAGMSGGAFGEVALYYPFERVHGLKLVRDPHSGVPERVEVHLIADLRALLHTSPPTPLVTVADSARSVVVKQCALPVDVIFSGGQ